MEQKLGDGKNKTLEIKYLGDLSFVCILNKKRNNIR